MTLLEVPGWQALRSHDIRLSMRSREGPLEKYFGKKSMRSREGPLEKYFGKKTSKSLPNLLTSQNWPPLILDYQNWPPLLLNYVFLWLETWMDYSTLMSSVQEYRWNPSKDRRNEWWSLEQKVTFFFKIFLNTMGFMGGLSGVFSCIIIRGEDWTLITKNNN